MLISNERPVRVFISKHLSLRGREVKVAVFRVSPNRLTLVLVGSRTGQVQLMGPRSTQNSSQNWAWSAGKH